MSSVDSAEVDSVLRDMMSEDESATLEADEDEESPEIIWEDDNETLWDLYMPSYEKGSPTDVVIDAGWRRTCLKHNFCHRALEAFAFLDDYALVLLVEGSRVPDCPVGHIAIYAHLLDFGLRFPLDPFIVKIFKAWNICLSQLTLLYIGVI